MLQKAQSKKKKSVRLKVSLPILVTEKWRTENKKRYQFTQQLHSCFTEVCRTHVKIPKHTGTTMTERKSILFQEVNKWHFFLLFVQQYRECWAFYFIYQRKPIIKSTLFSKPFRRKAGKPQGKELTTHQVLTHSSSALNSLPEEETLTGNIIGILEIS